MSKRRGKAQEGGGDGMALFDPAAMSTRQDGEKGTLQYRMHFLYNAIPISPWHDIPLRAKGGSYNFLCEIPKWTRAKFEVATAEDGNPIKQDEKKGVLRDYKWGDMLFNYGMLPQTWEDPSHIDPDANAKGDGDPVDAVEFGARQMASGSVAPVRVLGVLGMIDDGEADWKVLVLRLDDPLAATVHDVAGLELALPGAVSALREWLRVYKVAEGKPVNSFCLEEKAMPPAFAEAVIARTHADWAAAHASKRNAGLPYSDVPPETGAEGAAKKRRPKL